MSRIRKDYESSFFYFFHRWMEGDGESINDSLEMKKPEELKKKDILLNKDDLEKAIYDEKKNQRLQTFDFIYRITSLVVCILIIGVLLYTIAFMPSFGRAENPSNNEVAARYIESGIEETGAVNFVTGMILDYRAFDTFGESCVLFIAATCVQILLSIDQKSKKKELQWDGNVDDRTFEPKNDLILQTVSSVLVPIVMIFGIYVVLNGHLSPGGGFSGGAIIGAGLILYQNAFGFKKTEKFLTAKTLRLITLVSLVFYCLAKSYSFYTGANHLENIIPKGIPGNILSSGLILPLNIAVGAVVACTMYSFYSLFRKGGI
ncbi:MAG: hypothetical protein KBS81_06075 [Spirochaetales bacterium]|nr:hypothetical protein [Candidatus Physcosoma equi]